MQFITHKKEIILGDRLIKAIEGVKSDLINLAYAIRKEDNYAAHVTDLQKDQILEKSLQSANDIYNKLNNFTIWQRINTKLTGECIALLN